MKITVDMMMAKNPCPRWPHKRVAAYLGDGKTEIEMLRDSLAGNGISPKDAIWGATQFLPDNINRAFAIWCAKQYKTDKKEITDYIDVIERYYNGEATKEELDAAYWAAYWAADRDADRAAYWAAYWAADRAADRAVSWRHSAQKLIKIIELEGKK